MGLLSSLAAWEPGTNSYRAPSIEEQRRQLDIIKMNADVQRQREANVVRERQALETERLSQQLLRERHRASVIHPGPMTRAAMPSRPGLHQSGLHALDLVHQERRMHENELERMRILDQERRISYGRQQQMAQYGRRTRSQSDWLVQQQVRAREELERERSVEQRRLAEVGEAMRLRQRHQDAAEAALRRRESELAQRERAEAQRQAEIAEGHRRRVMQARDAMQRRSAEIEQRELELCHAQLNRRESHLARAEAEYRFEEEQKLHVYTQGQSLSVPSSPDRMGHRRHASDSSSRAHVDARVLSPEVPHDEASPRRRPVSMHNDLTRSASSHSAPRRSDTWRPGQPSASPFVQTHSPTGGGHPRRDQLPLHRHDTVHSSPSSLRPPAADERHVHYSAPSTFQHEFNEGPDDRYDEPPLFPRAHSVDLPALPTTFAISRPSHSRTGSRTSSHHPMMDDGGYRSRRTSAAYSPAATEYAGQSRPASPFSTYTSHSRHPSFESSSAHSPGTRSRRSSGALL